MLCSFLILVLDMIGLYMVFVYSKMGLVIALNVDTINSFCLPHFVEVSVFRMLSICFALVMVTFLCCENVNFGSRVISKISRCFVVGSIWLFNLSDISYFLRCLLCVAPGDIVICVILLFCIFCIFYILLYVVQSVV